MSSRNHRRLHPILAVFLPAAAAALAAGACGNSSEEEAILANLSTPCALPSDCKDPLICAFERCHAECSDSRDCDDGQRCVKNGDDEGVCQLEDETGCESDDDCNGSQRCAEDGECRDSCDSDLECVDYQSCTPSGACAEREELDDEGNLSGASSGGEGGAGGGGGMDSPDAGPDGEVTAGNAENGYIVNECPEETGDPVVHSNESITESLTWSGLHQVEGGLGVRAPLALEPCTVVRFGNAAYLTVSDNGSLHAVGDPDQPVVFSSARPSPDKGDWAGISIDGTASNDSELTNVIVEFGGSSGSPITVTTGAMLAFSNVVVRNTADGHWAIDLSTGAPSEFEGVHSVDNENGLFVSASNVPLLGSFTSDSPWIQVLGQTISEDAAWNDLGVPYRLDRSFYVQAELAIGPGVVLELPEGGNLSVTANGSLKAVGTEDKPVTFTSDQTSKAKGDWDAIYVDGTAASDSRLENVIVEFAGSSASPITIQSGGAMALVNVVVRDTSDTRNAIDLSAGAPSEFEGVHSERNKYGLYVSANTVPLLGSFTSDGPSINVLAQTITTDASWKDFGVPYALGGSMAVQAEFALAPGVVVELAEGAYINANSNGSLLFVGTAEKPITFTSDQSSPAPGDWDGIYVEGTASSDSRLENVVIEYGGSGTRGSINVAASATLSLSDVTVRDSTEASCAVKFESGSTVAAFENMTLEENLYPLCVYPSHVADLGSLTADDDAFIVVSPAALSMPAIWKDLGYPYRIDGTFSITALLTLEAGVDLRMNSNVGLNFDAAGGIHALGTEEENVTFAGVLEGADAGDWSQLSFAANSATNSSLEWTVIRDGGGNSGYGAVYISDRTVTLDNVTLENNQTCDVKLVGTGMVDDTGTDFVPCP